MGGIPINERRDDLSGEYHVFLDVESREEALHEVEKHVTELRLRGYEGTEHHYVAEEDGVHEVLVVIEKE